ncbi:MAG: hypothetical protein IT573_10035 [Deltaproteobacteria bacterium]|nr:hypothetical protein [Deltaproteobacteria bacterium]
MGAPPGVGDASSATRPAQHLQPGVPPAKPAEPKSPVPPSSPGAPPDTKFLQNPNATDPLKLMGVDEKRLKLTRGLRLYQDRHLDTAKLELKPIADNPLAKNVLGQIQNHEAVFHARQLAFVLKALGKDAAGPCSFSDAQAAKLTQAIEAIESRLILDAGTDLDKAVAAAKEGFDPEVRKVWDCFAQIQKTPLAELAAAFQETDPGLLADQLLRLAELHRDRKHFGTSWALAQIAAEYPKTEQRAKQLSAYLEGKRLSTEYVLSDMFDHGGSSIAIDLLALAPSVALTRRLSTVAWLAKRRGIARVPMTLLAGGVMHWGSTKVLKGLTGFDGKIMPGSWREFGGELTSSTLQNSFALLLANRKLYWGRPGPKPVLAAAEGAEAAQATEAFETAVTTAKAALTKPKLGFARQALRSGQVFGRGLWWSAKTGLKVGTIGVGDLALVKTPLHHFNVHDMTQRGMPQYALKLFPKTREARQIVSETYGARNLYREYQKRGDGAAKLPNTLPGVEPALDLDVFLTQLDPSLQGDKREAAYAVLAEAASNEKLGLNIRRWVLQKRKLEEWEGANRTLERQGIPLRYDAKGALCFTDSESYPCPEPPAKKP